jgi:hypothetical protein
MPCAGVVSFLYLIPIPKAKVSLVYSVRRMRRHFSYGFYIKFHNVILLMFHFWQTLVDYSPGWMFYAKNSTSSESLMCCGLLSFVQYAQKLKRSG